MTSFSVDLDAALLRTILGTSPPADLFIGDDWRSTRLRAQLQRVVPLLYRLVDSVPNDLDDQQRGDLLQLQGEAMSWVVRVEHHLLHAAHALEHADIAFAVLKGAATAHLDYAEPTWRHFGDADLLVSPEVFDEARAVVSRSGWVQGYPVPKRHEEFTHAITFVRNGVELDLHQRVGHRAIGRLIPPSSLLDARLPFEIAGARLHALSARDRLIHAAVHAVTSRGNTKRLSSVADVLLLAHRQQETAADVLARAETWSVRKLVERAVTDAYGTAMTPISEPWRDAIGQQRHGPRTLVERAHLSEKRRPVLEELAYLHLLGWGERARYVDGHIRPGGAYRAANQHGGERSHLAYLRSRMRRSATAEPLPLAMRPPSDQELPNRETKVIG